MYFGATPNWKGSEFCALLPHISAAVLQGDGYAGYPKFVERHPGLIEAGCLDHARRKVYEAYSCKDSSATWMMDLIRRIYAVEARAKQRGVNLEQLLEMRQTESKPRFAQLFGFIRSIGHELVRGSLLHRAVTYLVNQKHKLLAYLDDPRIPVSNVHVERALKLVAMVRKNSQIAGSFEGAQRLARYMTLIANCKIAGINPQHSLTDVLTRCARGWPIGRLHELMPKVWAPETPEIGLPALREYVFTH